MTITIRTTIKAPREKVFALFTDFKNLQERISAITNVTFVEGDGTAREGFRWRETRVMFGKEATEEMWISDIKVNEYYIVDAESHGMKYRSTYTFADAEGGTDVVLEFTGTPVSFGAKLFAPLFVFFKSSTKKAFQADIDELKSILEQS